MTHAGGSVPFESSDGHSLWYSKEHSKGGSGVTLWNAPTGGGHEQLVLESLANVSTYAVTQTGIYFVGHDRSGPGTSIQFLDMKTGRFSRVAPVERPLALGLAVSPDRQSILYSEMEHRQSDLMLVENFPYSSGRQGTAK